MAANFLEKKGYQILEKNYFSMFGEIDVIAKKDDEYIFIEVKTRTVSRPLMVSGEEAVSLGKRKKMLKTIQKYFLSEHFAYEVPWRCDVMVIEIHPHFARIYHYPYAFELYIP